MDNCVTHAPRFKCMSTVVGSIRTTTLIDIVDVQTNRLRCTQHLQQLSQRPKTAIAAELIYSMTAKHREAQRSKDGIRPSHLRVASPNEPALLISMQS
jgi:hypothetical protein